MRFSFSRTGATAVLVFLLISTAGCALVNKVRAKNELNEAARSYRDGRFDEAEQHARRALALDESNKTAPIFIARIIHQQYKPGVDQPDNVQKARDAIDAYQRVLQSDTDEKQKEEAYKAISVLLTAIKDEVKLRDWIMKRANDTNQKPEARAEAFAILAGKDWDCSYKITELPDVKVTSNEGGNVKVTYKKPSQKDFDNIQKCVARGMEEAETAIKLDPNNESGWSYKANLLRERAKIANMNGDTAQQSELEKQSQVAAKRAAALAEEKRKQEAAAEAASSPSP